ncbi:hypothetical protein KUTeg_004855 [Tegillarca granosa]|uniref:Putative Dachshund-homology domain-containing protein n=1 Tax=Tegillarca granosa TaxID=220873 RepID=A0ABQ9FJW9_TEGGR|nr:hypothetical protein KUTeg_004855 [Tegillarca granosa]
MDDSSLDGIGYDDSESPQSDLSQDSGFSDSGHSPDVDNESHKIVHSQYLNRQKETPPSSSHLFLSDSKKPVAILEIPPQAVHTSPKVGKYRIGTFASVSNSTMGLEVAQIKISIIRPASLLTSPVYSSSLLSENVELYKHQVPCTGEKYSVPGTPVMKSDIEHDHDYCLPWDNHASMVANSPSSKLLKDASCRDGLGNKQKEKKSESIEKRRRMSSASSDKDYIGSMDDTDLSSPDSVLGSPLPSTIPQSLLQNTKHRVKLEKIAEYVKTGNSESKLKITGSFQDDYIYFLNTKSRSRRRTSHDVKPPVPSDKILIPLPKPGDIVVPHLTDADLEAIKQRRNVPKKSARLQSPMFHWYKPTSTTLPPVSSNEVRTESNGDDVSKNIIDTILSLESGEPSSYSVSEPAPVVETSTYGDNFVMGFSPEQMNLTPEQMEILYSAMDQVSETEIKSTSNGGDEVRTTMSDSSKVIDGSSSESRKGDTPPVSMDDKGISGVGQQPDNCTSSGVVPNCTSSDTLPNVHNKTHGSTVFEDKVDLPAVSKETVPTSTGPAISSVALPSSEHRSVVNSLPDLPFTSMEKSALDLFGNELKLFPEASVPETNIQPATNDYDAPWIVTVSMYWNDLPAIMIDNLPFVRLVDIHKQILPAKDTGILKKRCQLLGIDVRNCSEMQRYFLVQYGKAFNSKSTLIVSKEDATSLIGYYVNPVPKVHRSETEKSDRQKLIESGTHHRQSKSSARSSSSSKHHDVESVKQLETSPQKIQNVAPAPIMVQPSVSSDLPITVRNHYSSPKQGEQISRRTRHKKINFLEMLKGDQNNNTTPDQQDNEEINVDEDKERVKSNKVTKDVEKSDKNKHSTSRKKSPVAKETVKVAAVLCSQASQDEQSCNESETENRSFNKDAIFINPKRKLCPLDSKKSRLDKTKKSGALKVKWTIFNKNQLNKKKLTESKHEKKEILSVIHKDVVVRNGNKSRVQSGSVFLDQFEAQDSACVRCCTCKKFISIENFLNHLHEVGGSGKLIAINEPQTLALRDMYPSDAQKRLWKNFQEKLRRMRKCDKESELVTERKMLLNNKDRVNENPIVASTSDIKKHVNNQHAGSTRISARKRKQKQLYPIENYSFSKSQPMRKLIDSDDESPRSPLLERSCDAYDDSPVKRMKLDTNHNNDSEITFPSHVTSKMECESVLTLTNGPEMTSFTALADDESFDL